MDQRSFENLVQVAERSHRSATQSAEGMVVPLLFCGVICGVLLARWIFRGGLSRARNNREFITGANDGPPR